jgi:hypothetical protein
MASKQHSRRREGFRLLAAGRTPRQVAAKLGVAVSTVYGWQTQRRAPLQGAPIWDFRAATRLLTAKAPRVLQKLLSLAEAGDMRAIALVVRLLGGVSPEAQIERLYLERRQEELDHILSRHVPQFGVNVKAVLAEATAKTDEAFANQPIPVYLRPRVPKL